MSQPKQKRPFKKANKAQASSRTKQVVDWILLGYTRSEIVRFCSDKWDIGDRQVDDYMAAANREIKEVNLMTIDQTLAQITKAMWNEYRKAHEASDRIAALKAIAQFKGIGKINLDLVVDDQRELESYSDDELEKALEEAWKAADG